MSVDAMMVSATNGLKEKNMSVWKPDHYGIRNPKSRPRRPPHSHEETYPSLWGYEKTAIKR